MLTAGRLDEILSRFGDCRIAVLGDFFLDRYWDINPDWEELSVETGLPAYQVAAVRCSPGAAGTVVANLASLGAGRLDAIGFTGDDGEGFELRRGLKELNCNIDQLHTAADRFTPTYTKPRDVNEPGLAGEHSRLDTKNRRATPEDIEQAVIESLSAIVSDFDAVIVLDQVEATGCGVVTEQVRLHLGNVAKAHPDVIFWADSRRHVDQFENMIIKPNEFETIGRTDPQPGEVVGVDQLQEHAQQLHEQTGRPVFITRGAGGMSVFDADWHDVPGVNVAGEIDTTGAGDSVTAGCVLALCSGASPVEAAVIGNLVASLTVQQLAVTGTATCEQLPPRLEMWREQNGMID